MLLVQSNLMLYSIERNAICYASSEKDFACVYHYYLGKINDTHDASHKVSSRACSF